jgi:hypothetical protein
MKTEITTIETYNGHRYAVTRTADGRELRRAACDGIGLPDGTELDRHTPSPPLNWAVGKTVASIADGWRNDDGLPDNQIRIVFTDGSRLLFSAGGAYELSFQWEPTE